MVLIGYTIMAFGFIFFSQIQNTWQFYLSYFIIAFGGGLGGWLAILTLVNNWFIRRRTFAMATSMSGVHFGGFLVPVLALGLEAHGFRTTTLGIGIFLLVAILPISKMIRNRPEDSGLLPDGDPPPEIATSTIGTEEVVDDEREPEFTARQALRTPVFWTLALIHMTSTVSIVTLAVHLVPKLTDMGFTMSSASLVVLLFTLIALPTQFVAGYIGDKFSKPPVLVVFLLFQAVSLTIIALAEQAWMAYLFAVLYGIGIGGRIPLLTALRGDYFGRKAYATIMGVSMFPNNLGMIVAPLFAGYMFDTTDSYFIPFIIFAGLGFVGTFGMLFVRKPKGGGFRGTQEGS
jgi:MFS family permease